MKITFFTVIIVSMMLLVSASVWEGVTEADSAGDISGNYSVATNAFPRNTVVDITNLENGKMVRVKVVSGLEQTGLLAILSRTAAESIDLRGDSSGRIRMTQPSDDIAFSLFNLGPIAAAASLAAASYAAESDVPAETNDLRADNNAGVPAETYTEDIAAADNTAVSAENFDTTGGDQALAASSSAPTYNPVESYPAGILLSPLIAAIPGTTAETSVHYGEPGPVYGRLSLVPSEERIPTATGYVIAPEDIIPPLGVTVAAQTEAEYAPPILAAAVQPENEYAPPVESSADFSPFLVPLISRLEPNKWYVQVALYGRPEYVEDEISRIGTSYPLTVQNVGTDTNPLFRVLLGPLNQGESGAMLQRFKSLGYADAFVRHQ
jgi:cell division septation protein DedD